MVGCTPTPSSLTAAWVIIIFYRTIVIKTFIYNLTIVNSEMHNQMPQEIEVWYIIPAIRRELVKSMLNNIKLPQKQIARIIGVTEAAVSQYVHSKRAKEVVFSKAIQNEIKKSANIVFKNSGLLIPEMVRLTRLTQVKHVMCDLHKKRDVKLSDNCDVCFHEEKLIKIKNG